jgi:hypothetical protein
MALADNQSAVIYDFPNGDSITLWVDIEHGSNQIFIWLETNLNLETILPFYRVYEKGASPEESWQTFQEGKEIAKYANGKGAALGAIERLSNGNYVVDVKIITEEDSIKLESIFLQIEAAQLDEVTQLSNKNFQKSFNKIFKQFLEKKQTKNELIKFYEEVTENQCEEMFKGLIKIGGPENYCDDYTDIKGFFEFIDYITAITYSFGDFAITKLEKYPNSPNNQHYIHYVKQYLSDERLYSKILKKYPFCSGRP